MDLLDWAFVRAQVPGVEMSQIGSFRRLRCKVSLCALSKVYSTSDNRSTASRSPVNI
jgi:hypothetical protein